ncbi:unnamed protein product [Cylindrotheca closterium]|uniref:Uncharacterized protein n=1 Tax=Cylindrotheca closterium TaxID=2856 RepID=A0AAD2G8G2_9STRA|nr:unnamed protein product [Cylindrotheca closterium]
MEEKDYNENTPLHHASTGKRLENMELLMNQGANLEARNGKGDAPLHSICKSSKSDVDNKVHLLLDRGTNFEARNNDGRTPLHVATNLNAARIVLDRGANLEASGNTPLHVACSERNIGLIRLLLHRGADLEATTNRGYRPLHFEAVNAFTDVARLFLISRSGPWQIPRHLQERRPCPWHVKIAIWRLYGCR